MVDCDCLDGVDSGGEVSVGVDGEGSVTGSCRGLRDERSF